MKKLTIVVTALAGTMSLTGYSWGLGDALKAVDKATAVTDNKNSDDVRTENSTKSNVITPSPVSQYDSSRKVPLRLQLQQQLDAASQKGEISNESRNDINQWVCIQINSVNSNETEDKFKNDFDEKMSSAKAALLASKADMKTHEERAKADRENWARDSRMQEELRKQRENQDVVIRVSRLIAECDELVKKYEDALKDYDAKAKSIVSGLPSQMRSKSDAQRESLVCQEVDRYQQAKVAGDFSKTNSLDESRQLERDLERRKGCLERAIVQFDESSKLLDRMKEMGGQMQEEMTREAEANYRIAIDNSSDVYNEAARAQKKADADTLKGTLSSEEYAAKLREMTAALEEEVRVHRENENARRELIHSLKGKNPSEWTGAIGEQPEGDARKAFVRALLAAKGTRGYERKDVRDAAGALVKQYFTQDELIASIRDDKDTTDFWEVASSFVTDQDKLRDLLLVDDKWIRNCRRERVTVMTRQQVYYTLYKDITDQELLVKLLDIEEIDFQSSGSHSYGDRDHAVFERLDAAHFAVVDAERETRRTAVKGQTLDFNGLYLGMSRRDAIIMAYGKAKGVGKFGGEYGVFGNAGMSSLWLSAEARYKHLGIKKDGLTGLAELVEKFVPGGLKETGDVHVGGKADAGYDPENPEITVTTWWYVNVPQFKCCIRMYDSGSVKIYTTDEDDKVILDFSKTKNDVRTI